MGTLEILLLAFFLIFLVIVLMNMNNRIKERNNADAAERVHGESTTEKRD